MAPVCLGRHVRARGDCSLPAIQARCLGQVRGELPKPELLSCCHAPPCSSSDKKVVGDVKQGKHDWVR